MKRSDEALLTEFLSQFPCVAILGPRQCGKTTLLSALPQEWKCFDLERRADLELIERDPDLFLRLHSTRVAIDEAQVLPELFPALRVAIDADRQTPGRFIITGSSSPQLLHRISETLAGRVAIIEMSPFSCAEALGHTDGKFPRLLADKADARRLVATLEKRPRFPLKQVHDYWFRGGYPEPWLRNSPRFQSVWMEQYVQTYLHRDVARLFPGLDHNRYRLFIQLLAGLSGTIINYSDVARSLGVAQPTVRDYFEIAHGTFLWRRIPAFERNATKRIVKHARGYLRDSGLLHHLLRITDLDSLLSHPVLGRSWEGLVIEEVLRGLAALGQPCDAHYYRTGGGAEVDLVLDGDFGLIPIEIKYAGAVAPHDLKALDAFVRERKCRLGIVINNAERPLRIDERIAAIPFSFLA